MGGLHLHHRTAADEPVPAGWRTLRPIRRMPICLPGNVSRGLPNRRRAQHDLRPRRATTRGRLRDAIARCSGRVTLATSPRGNGQCQWGDLTCHPSGRLWRPHHHAYREALKRSFGGSAVHSIAGRPLRRCLTTSLALKRRGRLPRVGRSAIRSDRRNIERSTFSSTASRSVRHKDLLRLFDRESSWASRTKPVISGADFGVLCHPRTLQYPGSGKSASGRRKQDPRPEVITSMPSTST